MELKHLVEELLGKKQEENLACKRRIECEERVAALIPGPDSGQKTVTLADGTKVTVKRGWNYKADLDNIRNVITSNYPNDFVPIKSVTTHKLDEKGYEYYRDRCSAIFSLISPFVEAKPKKVAVEVKRK